MNLIIADAIRNQNILELRYHGYSRLVEPHAYGRDKEGDELLRCYQVSGGSESGERAGWKLLKVRDVYSLVLTKEKFTTRPDYRRGDKAITHLLIEI